MRNVRRIRFGIVPVVAMMIVAAVPAQPAHAAIPVLVDIPFVSYYGDTHISVYMRVDIPDSIRQQGTCEFYFSEVGPGGNSVHAIDHYSDSCDYSPTPYWGDRRESWAFEYPYGDGTYIVAAHFTLGAYHGSDFYEFSTAQRQT